jgi:hypothetical protein
MQSGRNRPMPNTLVPVPAIDCVMMRIRVNIRLTMCAKVTHTYRPTILVINRLPDVGLSSPTAKLNVVYALRAGWNLKALPCGTSQFLQPI